MALIWTKLQHPWHRYLDIQIWVAQKKSMRIPGIWYRYTFRAWSSCTSKNIRISQESIAISAPKGHLPLSGPLRGRNRASLPRRRLLRGICPAGHSAPLMGSPLSHAHVHHADRGALLAEHAYPRNLFLKLHKNKSMHIPGIYYAGNPCQGCKIK